MCGKVYTGMLKLAQNPQKRLLDNLIILIVLEMAWNKMWDFKSKKNVLGGILLLFQPGINISYPLILTRSVHNRAWEMLVFRNILRTYWVIPRERLK